MGDFATHTRPRYAALRVVSRSDRGVSPRLSLRYALAGICPPMLLFPDGVARHRGAGARGVGSAKVIIFRFMYKCLARGARPFLLLGKMPIVKFFAEN